MDLMKFVVEKALILVPALYVIGMVLKDSIIKDKLIPVSLLVLGILGAVALLGLSVESVIQGILVAGVTVFTNQLIVQAKKE